MTQTAQHTSGLWTVEYPADEYGHYYLEQSAKREKCGFSSAEERAANCRLIAAAPDLLAALQLIVDMIDPYSLDKQGREARAQA
jgi:hypothetical protein